MESILHFREGRIGLREEKKYLVDEIGKHLDKSDYFYLTDFDQVSVADTAELRWKLLFQILNESFTRLKFAYHSLIWRSRVS